MDMTGEYRIPASRQRVWEALNDPETLKQAITGCEELTQTGPNELEAAVRSKIGPVSARFTGKVTLSDLNPPESYRISGEGKGGAAGFAKGGAVVNLAEDGDDTILRYTANAEVGGKLAQIGSRLVQGTAKKMADDFFSKFALIVGGAPAIGETGTAENALSAPSAVTPTTAPLHDPVAAETTGTVGLDRPASDPTTSAVMRGNAAIDGGPPPPAAAPTAARPASVPPAMSRPPASTSTSPLPDEAAPWYKNTTVLVAAAVIVLVLIWMLS